MDGFTLVCVCVITCLPINESEIVRHQSRGVSQSLLLILTLDSYLHTPAKLLIGQLLSFRSGPAQCEKRDGFRSSMGDFGNYCSLSHLAEVFTKLIWHKQVGEEAQSSTELWLQFRLCVGAAI